MKKTIIVIMIIVLGTGSVFANDWSGLSDDAIIVDNDGERTWAEEKEIIAQAENNFSDLSSHWGRTNIIRLYNMGGISGYPDGTVKPDGTVTRAEFLALISKTVYPENVGKAKSGEHWAKPFFDAAVENGIMHEIKIDEETWNDNITRYEMAEIIVKFLDNVIGEERDYVLGVEEIMEDYDKVTSGREKMYSYYVQQAFVKGIITGRNANGLFAGNDNGTRAEAATLIIRLIDTEARKEVVLKPDNEVLQEENNKDDEILKEELSQEDSEYTYYEPYIEGLLLEQERESFQWLDHSSNIDEFISLEISDPSLITTLKDFEYMTDLQSISLGSTNSKTNISHLELELLDSSTELKYLSLYDIDEESINYILENINVETILINSSYILDNLNSIRNTKIKEVFIFAPVLETKALTDMSSEINITFNSKGDWNDSIEKNNELITRINNAERDEKIAKEAEEKAKEAEEKAKIAKEKAREIVSTKINDSMDEVTKIRVLHDYLVNTISYDYDSYLNDTIDPISYTSYGAIINKSAVCDGYANAMQDLLSEAGFESHKVIGTAKGISDSYDSHAWNIVNVNGEYKNIDVTWDDPIVFDGSNRVERLRYDYFLVDDAKLGIDHKWERADYPTCD